MRSVQCFTLLSTDRKSSESVRVLRILQYSQRISENSSAQLSLFCDKKMTKHALNVIGKSATYTEQQSKRLITYPLKLTYYFHYLFQVSI
uniref:Uncharacterized protein n=1 Tax=Parascaris univalens TaxID=6257 RepID=A0A915BUJ2_PARUN